MLVRLGRTVAALALVVSGLAVAGVAASPPAQAALGFPATADLNGRPGESLDANVVEVDMYKNGQTVNVVCQAHGGPAYGSTIWDKTTENVWVPDAYVKTGVDGFHPDLPRCDDDQPPQVDDCGVGHGRINGPRGSTAGTAAERVARAIAVARGQVGKDLSYSWGGGGKGGPACGISSPSPGGHVDYDRFGFDCSGYTLYAFWKGAGVDIGAYTGAQYGVGRRVPYADRAVGDLIFWGSSASDTTHVAIYLGEDRILEAAPPRGTDSVHETTVYGSTRLGSVVRVLG